MVESAETDASELTAEMQARLERVIEDTKDLEGPCLPVLKAVQDEFGYVPAGAIPVVARALNLSRAEVHGVLTFYHDLRRAPAGQHIVKVCRAESCQAAGGETVAADVEQRLGIAFGETTPDQSISLEPVYCLGNCALSPAAMVDERLLGRATADSISGTIERIEKEGA